jgi:hypothetical protein
VLERRVLEGVLLLPADGDDIALLVGTGRELWDLLRETRSIRELTDLLEHRYAGDANTIRADVEAALAVLERDGLVCGQT